MLLRPRGYCRFSSHSSSLLQQHILSSRPLYHPVRNYASPQPRSYHNSPKSKPPNAAPKFQPSSILPLSGVLPTKTTLDPLNPPSTTRPPPLTLPSRPADLPAFKYYFRLGKAYAQFYKTGLKAIYRNWKTARQLPDGLFNLSQFEIRAAVESGSLTRAEFQLIRRAKNDVNKLPLFVLVWLVCGEFTPLVVVFVSRLVPRIIWIPKQVQQAREKTEARRKLALEESIVHFNGPTKLEIIDQMVEPRRTNAYRYYARSLGLYPGLWDRFPSSVLPIWLLKRKVQKRIEYLETDDFAIVRDGGVERMQEQELVWACEDRGIDVLGKEGRELMKDLKSWMETRRKTEPGR